MRTRVVSISCECNAPFVVCIRFYETLSFSRNIAQLLIMRQKRAVLAHGAPIKTHDQFERETC